MKRSLKAHFGLIYQLYWFIERQTTTDINICKVHIDDKGGKDFPWNRYLLPSLNYVWKDDEQGPDDSWDLTEVVKCRR